MALEVFSLKQGSLFFMKSNSYYIFIPEASAIANLLTPVVQSREIYQQV